MQAEIDMHTHTHTHTYICNLNSFNYHYYSLTRCLQPVKKGLGIRENVHCLVHSGDSMAIVGKIFQTAEKLSLLPTSHVSMQLSETCIFCFPACVYNCTTWLLFIFLGLIPRFVPMHTSKEVCSSKCECDTHSHSLVLFLPPKEPSMLLHAQKAQTSCVFCAFTSAHKQNPKFHSL
jgi:hypothetical protein